MIILIAILFCALANCKQVTNTLNANAVLEVASNSQGIGFFN
jgi:hypothetical protein